MGLKLRILHIEDEPLDTELASTVLSRDGLAVEIDRVEAVSEFQAALESRE